MEFATVRKPEWMILAKEHFFFRPIKKIGLAVRVITY